MFPLTRFLEKRVKELIVTNTVLTKNPGLVKNSNTLFQNNIVVLFVCLFVFFLHLQISSGI